MFVLRVRVVFFVSVCVALLSLSLCVCLKVYSLDYGAPGSGSQPGHGAAPAASQLASPSAACCRQLQSSGPGRQV